MSSSIESKTVGQEMFRLIPDETRVALWHAAFGLPVRPYGTRITAVSEKEIMLAVNIFFEEVLELLESLNIKIRIDEDGVPHLRRLYKTAVRDLFHEVSPVEEPSRVNVFDAICDSIFTLHALAARLGLPTNEGLAEVTASNFSKLGPDGKPILNGVTPGYRFGEAGYRKDAPDGKILKGPGYYPPKLAQLIAGYEAEAAKAAKVK